MSIKESRDDNGKRKFQAQVWYDNKFYGSKTFDSPALAAAWHDRQYKQAVLGTILPVAQARARKEAQAALDDTLEVWAERYLADIGTRHSAKRRYDYSLVGSLLRTVKLREFSGKNGSRKIQELATQWRHDRRPRRQPGVDESARDRPQRPLSSNTVRLRLSALMRLLRFAKMRLPDEVQFVVPNLKEDLFEFKMPPAHEAPRQRIPSDEEFARLLVALESRPDVSDLLQITDECGNRLSEIRTADSSNVSFCFDGETLIGGVVLLRQHKTQGSEGDRSLVLSRHAARVVHARIQRQGDGPLFPSLEMEHAVDANIAACKSAGIEDLQYKDFRRGLINRARGTVPDLTLMKLGLLEVPKDRASLSQEDQQLLKLVGHRRPQTTVGYTTVELQEACGLLNQVSRMSRVLDLVRQLKAAGKQDQGSLSSVPRSIPARRRDGQDAGNEWASALRARQSALRAELERIEIALRLQGVGHKAR